MAGAAGFGGGGGTGLVFCRQGASANAAANEPALGTFFTCLGVVGTVLPGKMSSGLQMTMAMLIGVCGGPVGCCCRIRAASASHRLAPATDWKKGSVLVEDAEVMIVKSSPVAFQFVIGVFIVAAGLLH